MQPRRACTSRREDRPPPPSELIVSGSTPPALHFMQHHCRRHNQCHIWPELMADLSDVSTEPSEDENENVLFRGLQQCCQKVLFRLAPVHRIS